MAHLLPACMLSSQDIPHHPPLRNLFPEAGTLCWVGNNAEKLWASGWRKILYPEKWFYVTKLGHNITFITCTCFTNVLDCMMAYSFCITLSSRAELSHCAQRVNCRCWRTPKILKCSPAKCVLELDWERLSPGFSLQPHLQTPGLSW